MKSKILAVSVLLLNLNGCTVAPKQAYEGTPLAPEAQAVLSVAGKHSAVGFHNKTYIAQVDGKSMRDVGATLAGQSFPYTLPCILLSNSGVTRRG